MNTTMDMTSILSVIASMEAQLNALKSSVSGASGVKAPLKEKKARKPRDPTLPPTAWILFTGRVRALLKENGYATGVENQMFCSFLKDQKPLDNWTDAEIVSARASWTKPEHSKAELSGKPKRKSSDASDSAPVEPKPERAKRVYTEEEKKAIAERLAAGRARKAAEKALATEGVAPEVSDSASVAGSEGGAETDASTGSKRGRPKGSKNKPKTDAEKAEAKAKRDAKKMVPGVSYVIPATFEPVSTPAPVVSAPAVALTKVLLKGHQYLLDKSTNGIWNREADGSKGPWAGIYNAKTKSIDDSAAEPMSESEIDA